LKVLSPSDYKSLIAIVCLDRFTLPIRLLETRLPFHAACGDRQLAAEPAMPVVLFSEKPK
jgi:hypothetical protein